MSQFFKFPINYVYGNQSFSIDSQGTRSGANGISDNDYRTSSDESRFIIQTHGETETDNTRITHVFLKGMGIDNYSVTVPSGKGTGTGFTNQTIPTSQSVNSIQHDLREVGPLSATEVQLNVNGTSSSVIEVMLLESLQTIEHAYTAVNPTKVDRGGSLRTNIRGNTFKVQGTEGRFKWSTDFSALFLPSANPSADDVIRVFEENPNFTFAEDFSMWSDRVYPATIAGGVNISYLGRMFNQRQLEFSILEM